MCLPISFNPCRCGGVTRFHFLGDRSKIGMTDATWTSHSNEKGGNPCITVNSIHTSVYVYMQIYTHKPTLKYTYIQYTHLYFSYSFSGLSLQQILLRQCCTFQIDASTEYYRRTMSEKLRTYMLSPSCDKILMERLIFIDRPPPETHKGHLMGEVRQRFRIVTLCW